MYLYNIHNYEINLFFINLFIIQISLLGIFLSIYLCSNSPANCNNEYFIMTLLDYIDYI